MKKIVAAFLQVWCVQFWGNYLGTCDIEIALARNEPDASSWSSWFPESPAWDPQGAWSCGGKDHLGMLANVSHETNYKTLWESAHVTNWLLFFVWFEQGSESAPVLCSADGSAEAFEPARASFTTVVFSTVNICERRFNHILLCLISQPRDLRNVNEIKFTMFLV